MSENNNMENNKPCMLSSILEEYGLDSAKTKLVRHSYTKTDCRECYDKGFIEDYQSIQSRPIFRRCTHILSFIGGNTGTTAKFLGLYKVDKEYIDIDFSKFMRKGYPYPEQYKVDGYYYKLSPLDSMSDLKDKLIIEWGPAVDAWHQWAKNDKVILSFPDYVPVIEYFEDSSGKRITATTYERNPKARQKCLDKYGYSCQVCGFSSEEVYGNDFKTKIIEVHHINPISDQKGRHAINPEMELIPVCPNCHTMLHTKTSSGRYLEWKELKKIVEERQGG